MNSMRRIFVVMMVFGFFIGFIFPYVVDPFVIWDPDRILLFKITCIVAGLTVGSFCFYVIKITLYERNVILARRKADLEDAKERFSALTHAAITEKKWDVAFQDEHVPTCWEVKDCTYNECPLYGKHHVRCWLVTGTYCRGETQGRFAQKLSDCNECEVYQAAIGDNPFNEIGENFNSLMWAVREREDLLAEANAKLQSQYAELEVLHKQAKDMANTDMLTNLRNHGHFQQHLKKEIAKAKRYRRPLALMMLDLDHFKQINDKFGHPKGDAVLRCLGKLLAKEVRDVDYTARYGGEEFVVVMPETKGSEAIDMAERLRMKMDEVARGADLPKPYIGASFGVADLPVCATDGGSLISAADTALLHAKRNGRNQVVYFNEMPDGNLLEEEPPSEMRHAG